MEEKWKRSKTIAISVIFIVLPINEISLNPSKWVYFHLVLPWFQWQKLKAIYFVWPMLYSNSRGTVCSGNKSNSTISAVNLLGKYNSNNFFQHPIIILIDKHFSVYFIWIDFLLTKYWMLGKQMNEQQQ